MPLGVPGWRRRRIGTARRFPTDRARLRTAALRELRQISTHLVETGAVNADTGDALDPLVRAWGGQWRQRLVERLTRAETAAQHRLDRAEQRFEQARHRASVASRAVEHARVAAAGHRPPEAEGTPPGTLVHGDDSHLPTRQESNGVGTAAAR